MIRKLLASFAIAFIAGCATAPAGTESVDESTEALAKADQSLTCPGYATCVKADDNCLLYPGSSWCDTLAKCEACGYPGGYLVDEQPQAAKVKDTQFRVAADSEPSLTCPGYATCVKADDNCLLYPGSSWCQTLAKCEACGYPDGYATAEEPEAARANDTQARVAVDSEPSLTCPGYATCVKADDNCLLYPGSSWCDTLAKCEACGYPGGYLVDEQVQ